ncbi:MAG: non-proteolytic protein peptidase family [Gammaproteobacteria bacterium]|jgi:septal ring factor EnvC (AmiA/AmiB activator)|nr:non-proteolytic protein peptidase family [Gammaproteobacteria bacterium]
MPKKNSAIIYCFTIIIFFYAPFSAGAKPSLSDIQKEIKTVQKDLEEQQTSRTLLQKKLKISEEHLSQFKTKQQKTKKQLQKQAEQLNNLHEEKINNEKKLAIQQQALSDQIRTAYMSENGGFLKILLSQKNITDAQKNLVYYRYVLKKRSDLIAALHQTMEKLEQNTQAIEEKRKVLSELQAQHQSEINGIQDAQAQRAQVLEKTEATITSNNERLIVLQQNREALEAVLRQLKAKAATTNAVSQSSSRPTINIPTKDKGKMSWPTKGKVAVKYGSAIQGSELKLNGILIEAPLGENVRAAASGRIVFSQWMAGYGLLVIVDHGNSYMTLYGQNDVVYRKIGDSVSAGDVLATVGKSGGHKTPALYFAVRKDGKPVDPCLMLPSCST